MDMSDELIAKKNRRQTVVYGARVVIRFSMIYRSRRLRRV